MTTTTDELNGMTLREMIVPALKRKGAWRDNDTPQHDTLKQALRTSAVAEEIKKGGFPAEVKEIAIDLEKLVKTDQSLRPYVTYVGGYWQTPWENYEWSLPPMKG